MYRFGILKHIGKHHNTVRIQEDGLPINMVFTASYPEHLFTGFKKGDHIRYIREYVNEPQEKYIYISYVDLDPLYPGKEKRIWVRDAFEEMSKRVTAKRKEKR